MPKHKVREAARHRADKPAFGNQIRFAINTVRTVLDRRKKDEGERLPAHQDVDA